MRCAPPMIQVKPVGSGGMARLAFGELRRARGGVTGGAMTERSDRVAERVLAGSLLVGLAIGCAVVLLPFLSAIRWGGILVFTTWPVFTWFRARLHLGSRGAAGLMVLLTTVLIVLPIAVAAPAGADDAMALRRSFDLALDAGLPGAPAWVYGVPIAGPTLSDYWNQWAADLSVMVRFFSPWFGMLAESGLKILLGIASGLAQFLIALLVAFFFWASGDQLTVYLDRIARRIAGNRAQRLVTVTGKTVRGTVYGILGTAIVQGLLTTIGLYMSGVPRPLLLGLIAGLLSVLPIGAPVIWIPASLWLLGSGHTGWGIFLSLYGLFIISGSDNVIRPYFISRGAKLPFLLTILGVLGGALAFGLLGIFLGPVLLGVGYTLAAEFAIDGEEAVRDPDAPPNSTHEAVASARPIL
jgi:predicted PurR-regulated permease PerM